MAALWALVAYGAYANYDGDNSGSNYGGSNGNYGSPSPSYHSLRAPSNYGGYGNYGSYSSSYAPSLAVDGIHDGICNPNGTTSDPSRECSGVSQYAGSTADAYVLCSCESIPTHLYSTQTRT